MALASDVVDSLQSNSRTFLLPILKLEGDLQTAVASAYLSFRAIDEIEDHPELSIDTKEHLLLEIGSILTGSCEHHRSRIGKVLEAHREELPPVTLRLCDWLDLPPDEIAPRIADAVSTMSVRMGQWSRKRWNISTRFELDQYTFAVAGAVGITLADLFDWYADAKSSHTLAVQFGRGLQAVNMILNRKVDIEQGRDFFPNGWGFEEMDQYAHRCLQDGEAYMDSISDPVIQDAFRIPLHLATRSLQVFRRDSRKLTRSEVFETVGIAEE